MNTYLKIEGRAFLLAQTVPKHIVTLDFYQPVYRSQLENYHLSEEQQNYTAPRTFSE